MDYERNTTFANMYFATEIRFDAIAEALKNIVAKLNHRPVAGCKPIAA